MTQTNRSFTSKLLLVLTISALGVGGAYYYCSQRNIFSAHIEGISEYDSARDKQEILELFKTDLYWLSANPDYDAGYMLDNRAPSQGNLRYFGEMRIRVLREDNTFVGFVAYYKKNADEGFINFVCIKPEMRGKHYAERLMQYAENDLRSMGVHRIRLLTRTTNHRARALYTRLGYTVIELDEEGGFVYYMKIL